MLDKNLPHLMCVLKNALLTACCAPLKPSFENEQVEFARVLFAGFDGCRASPDHSRKRMIMDVSAHGRPLHIQIFVKAEVEDFVQRLLI